MMIRARLISEVRAADKILVKRVWLLAVVVRDLAFNVLDVQLHV